MDLDPSPRIAEAVRVRLATSNHTERTLADATGIPRATLQRRLAGLVPFTVRELGLIAHELGVDASSFFDDAETDAA